MPAPRSALLLSLLLVALLLAAACQDGASFLLRGEAARLDEPWFALEAPTAPDTAGELYAAHCADCHDGAGDGRAPGYTALSGMSPRAILASLEDGSMRRHAAAMSEGERRALAEWLTGRSVAESPVGPGAACEAEPTSALREPDPAWSGWGGDPESRGFRTAEEAGLAPEDVPHLELAWAFGFSEAVQSRSQPAVVGDLVVVGSQFGEVYALALDTGCVHWMFPADAAVRGAISVGEGPGGEAAVFFADFRTNVYAVALADGALLWKARIGRHPESSVTGSVALAEGRLYVPLSSMEVVTARNPEHPCCTSAGAVVALEAATGEELWRHRTIARPARQVGTTPRGTPVLAPSGAPVWSSPTIDADRRLLYVGTGQNYTRPTTDTSNAVLALDLDTGELAWSFQGTPDDAFNMACMAETGRENCPEPLGEDLDFGMAPILATRPDGSEILVVGQKSGVVFGLDPDQDGRLLWETRIGKGGALGGVHWGIATDGRLAYATNADHPGGLLGGEPEIDPVPGVYALDLVTGEVVWERPTPTDVCAGREGCFAAHSAAPTAIPGVVFAGSLDGHLRAYSSTDGSVLWDHDTARPFPTVNGVDARGGSIDGPGPVIAGGTLLAHSGYALFNQMPGNVLLAFEVAGR